MPFIIFYLSSTFAYIAFSIIKYHSPEKNRYSLNQLGFYSYCFIILFFTATRYRTGTDWSGYEDYFYNNNYSWEYLWSLFNELIYNLNLSVNYIFFICACLSLILKFKTISILTNRSVFLLILIVPFIINKDFGTIRQGLAISICFYSSLFIISKQPILFTILVIIAAQLHFSAIIFLISYPISKIIITKKLSFVIITSCFFVGYSNLIISMMNSILSLLSSDSRLGYKIMLYLSYSDDYENIYKNSFLDLATIKKFISILLLYYLIGYKKFSLSDHNQKLFFNLFILGTSIFFLFDGIEQLRRLNGYFDLFQFCLFISLIPLIKDKLNKYILIIYLWTSSLINLYGYTESYPEYLNHYNSILGTIF